MESGRDGGARNENHVIFDTRLAKTQLGFGQQESPWIPDFLKLTHWSETGFIRS